MGMYGLRSQIKYHQKRFPARYSLNPAEYGHFTAFVACLRACEEYVYKSHVDGYFVRSAV